MKIKKPLISWAIKAQLLERYIFNFRIKPETLTAKLPVKWLKPQVINGYSVVSFCILDINKLTVVPIPNFFNYETISCAYRIGVIDTAFGGENPAVYVTDRNADLPIITKLAPFFLADSIPYVKSSISHEGDLVRIQCNYGDGQRLFCAETKPGQLKSKMFDTVDQFKEFIKTGVASYTPSIYPDNMTRVDLHKTDTIYDAMEGTVEFSWLDGIWKDAGLELDSIIRAKGGEYKWMYKGLMSYE